MSVKPFLFAVFIVFRHPLSVFSPMLGVAGFRYAGGVPESSNPTSRQSVRMLVFEQRAFTFRRLADVVHNLRPTEYSTFRSCKQR